MTPNKAPKTKKENLVLKRLLNGPFPSKPNFKINDVFRVSRYRRTFDKDYQPNWTEEYFFIVKIENSMPPVYEPADLQDEQLLGTFYGHELLKILINPNATYRIEKALKKAWVYFCKICRLAE